MDMDKIKVGTKVKAICKCHQGMTGAVTKTYPERKLADVLLDVGDRDAICLPASNIEPA